MANTFKFGGAGKWAAKEGSVLAYNDENNNFKPLPFTFTRASTATRVNESGLIESVASGVPRIDFLDNADGHLLLEPSRTNIVPRSEDLDTGWSKLNVTIANNETTSPDGNVSAGLVTVTSTSGAHADYDTFTTSTTPSVAHYISCFVKKSTTRYIRLVEGYSSATLNFDLDNGEIVSLSGGASNSILQDFGNGWYRIGFQFTSNATGDLQFALYLNNNSNSASYAGAGEAVYLWGAQIELGSYATSYIPTSGAAVTRAAEVANNAGNSNIFSTTQGVLYFQASILSEDGISKRLSVSDGTVNNRATIEFDENSGRLRFFLSGSGTTSEAGNATGISKTDFVKIALRYNSTDVVAFVNGVKYTPAATSVLPSAFNRLSFNDGATGNPFYGKTKYVGYYNSSLSDSELIALTS